MNKSKRIIADSFESRNNYDENYNTPSGVFVEPTFTTNTKLYFTNSIHIFIVALFLGVLSLFNLLVGSWMSIFLLIRDGLNSIAFTSVVLFNYYSIKYSKDFRRDKTFNYGYTRLTIIATSVNTVYIAFEFLELTHELLEGFYEHEEEDTPHDVDPNYIYIGIRVLSIRIILLLYLIFWTLRDVSLINKLEDIIESKFPNYERFTENIDQTDTHDLFKTNSTLKSCSLIYFSLKILIIYELLGNASSIWGMFIPHHLGLVQHLAIFLRSTI